MKQIDAIHGHANAIFSWKSCIRATQAGRILRHHYATSAAILTALICTNPLTKEG
ncbi:hypothetical protein MKJ05_13405 [Citrobacter braakii]|nr:hypothetical protein [Citrobacter braakii]WAD29260.1 hypothetical protein MKJ05_13405 [Citrobacter braakii]